MVLAWSGWRRLGDGTQLSAGDSCLPTSQLGWPLHFHVFSQMLLRFSRQPHSSPAPVAQHTEREGRCCKSWCKAREITWSGPRRQDSKSSKCTAGYFKNSFYVFERQRYKEGERDLAPAGSLPTHCLAAPKLGRSGLGAWSFRSRMQVPRAQEFLSQTTSTSWLGPEQRGFELASHGCLCHRQWHCVLHHVLGPSRLILKLTTLHGL